MDVFSRDCFPDITNPGVDEDDVTEGCNDAKDFWDFFNLRFTQGLNAVSNVEAQLKEDGVSGQICFSDDKDAEILKYTSTASGMVTSLMLLVVTALSLMVGIW